MQFSLLSQTGIMRFLSNFVPPLKNHLDRYGKMY
nr:MAG TPA: hypothetical protein [Caudoviricetes sp.]